MDLPSHIEDVDYDSSSNETQMSTSTSSDSSSETEIEIHQSPEEFQGIINAYSNSDFKKNLRLNRSTVKKLIDRYKASEHFLINTNKGLPITLPEIEIFMFLWYMGNSNTFLQLSNLFGVTESTARSTINKVSSWLISISHNYIKWPTENETMQNATIFEERTKIPGILGFIGGSHIRIKMPTSSNRMDYYNEQKFYSINLQGVLDPNKKFINVFTGVPGSLDHWRVLRRSHLYRDNYENWAAFFPNSTFLLGDSTYTCLNWLVTPFQNYGKLSNEEKSFNDLHSAGHEFVKQTFEQLEDRFQRIAYFTDEDMSFVVNIVACGCILWNICIENNDEFDENFEEIFQNADDLHIWYMEGNRRQKLFDDLVTRNVISI